MSFESDVQIELPSGSVTGIWTKPPSPDCVYVMGHGAGAGARHKWMKAAADALADNGIATLRYNFLYMEQGKSMPDRHPALLSVVRAAVAEGSRLGLPTFAGGKSMGGRMTSLAESESPMGIQGIVFFGFPLHPSGKPSTERAQHLASVSVPMLFIQGDRDALAEWALLQPIIRELRANLTLIGGGDHSFHVQGRKVSDADVVSQITTEAANWMRARMQEP